MVNTTNSNRRQVYRLQPPPVWAPIFSIIVAGRQHTAAKVIDVNLQGVRVTFGAADLSALTPAALVTTSIRAPGLDGAVDIRGRVVFAMTRGDGLVVAIAFLDPPDLSDRVTADFFRVFNRREDERRRSAPGQDRISALVLNAAGEADGVIDLVLRDHSDKGVGFVVDQPTDAFLQNSAGLALPLSNQGAAVRPAQLRRRDAYDDAFHYGCTFAPNIAEPT